MKIVYCVDKSSFDSVDHTGVRKKVDSQIELMKKRGAEVILRKYSWVNGKPELIVDQDTNVLYFRRIESSINLITTLRRIREQNPHIRIIMEIPTYPFVGERRTFSVKRRINEHIGNIFLKSYVDRLAVVSTIGKIDHLYGIKTITMINGYDFESVSVKKQRNKALNDGKTINLICVSGCLPAHGYDRIIRSLGEYYNCKEDREINLYIVGEGECREEYAQLAKEYGLYNKHIFICGKLVGTELDSIYDKCDIAIGHLATHRAGLKITSSLKTREYAAKGLPMILAPRLDMCTKEAEQYIHYVNDDESTISISEIITFFDRVYDQDDVNSKIRATFAPLFDLKYTFNTVLEYIFS